jgi:hypothetical protein
LISLLPFARNIALVFENGAEPKNPLYADNGLGWGEEIERAGSKY